MVVPGYGKTVQNPVEKKERFLARWKSSYSFNQVKIYTICLKRQKFKSKKFPRCTSKKNDRRIFDATVNSKNWIINITRRVLLFQTFDPPIISQDVYGGENWSYLINDSVYSKRNFNYFSSCMRNIKFLPKLKKVGGLRSKHCTL